VAIQVNLEVCDGCGACVEACATGAIHMSGGVAIVDPEACTDCGDCVDTCLIGAITRVEVPAAMPQPTAIQPVRAVRGEVVSSSAPNRSPWLSAALAFAGRELLPRLADSLMAALDRRLAHRELGDSQPEGDRRRLASRAGPADGRGRRRRIRQGRSRPGGQGRGCGPGRGRWTQGDDEVT
jgi:NAD-dependent dihydropyrimidine dehydrogenase PreA subunit